MILADATSIIGGRWRFAAVYVPGLVEGLKERAGERHLLNGAVKGLARELAQRKVPAQQPSPLLETVPRHADQR
jgi:hypothetical protein